MREIFLLFSLFGSLTLVINDVAANDIDLEDLKPQFETRDEPDYTRPAPKMETDYNRFENWVKERSEADGFGLDYDGDNNAPMIIYKDSFE
ncbi:hypothetical protein IWQ52_000602 [Labrenzia sp. EL_159]|nr:hypothetical protein [Labrenzia sp. EL_162]MBG6193100.1 hypothetical protein [Labrenzia sp. EL_159]